MILYGCCVHIDLQRTLNGTIEPSTLQWINQHAERIILVAAERINLELF